MIDKKYLWLIIPLLAFIALEMLIIPILLFNSILSIPIIAAIFSIISSWLTAHWYAKSRDKKDAEFILNTYKYSLRDLLISTKLDKENAQNIRLLAYNKGNDIRNNYMISNNKLDASSLELKNTILQKIRDYQFALDDLIHSHAFDKISINNNEKRLYMLF